MTVSFEKQITCEDIDNFNDFLTEIYDLKGVYYMYFP
jgi:hypothetical protein